MSGNEVDTWDPTAWEADLRPSEDILAPKAGERVAVIRNSDRVLFRRCRRRWAWNSHLRGNLGPKQNAAPLWTGSGFHFALEDFHAFKQYPSAAEAFIAYRKATTKYKKYALPSDWQEQENLAVGMLDYYERHWLANRDPLNTFYWNGVPQVEVNFRIDIPWEPGKYGYDRVVYSGTIDRVAIDSQGLLWIVEYKTAKQIITTHFAVDGQVSAYTWAGNHLYPGFTCAGVIYQQHRKDVPHAPEWLASGRLSTNKQQLTTHHLYMLALRQLYGSVEKAPFQNVEFLNYLLKAEDIEYDRYVRRTRVYRNEHQGEAEGTKILMELDEMLNPELPLYPNPTRECIFMCSFKEPCVELDEGGDWEYLLQQLMEPRDRSYDEWRKHLEPWQPQSQQPPGFLLESQNQPQPILSLPPPERSAP